MNNQAACMSEIDYAFDMLNTEKHVLSLYSNAVIESSCPNLKQLMTTQYEQSAQDQYKVFELLNLRGKYPVPDAQDAEVAQAQQMYSNIKNTLN